MGEWGLLLSAELLPTCWIPAAHVQCNTCTSASTSLVHCVSPGQPRVVLHWPHVVIAEDQFIGHRWFWMKYFTVETRSQAIGSRKYTIVLCEHFRNIAFGNTAGEVMDSCYSLCRSLANAISVSLIRLTCFPTWLINAGILEPFEMFPSREKRSHVWWDLEIFQSFFWEAFFCLSPCEKTTRGKFAC